MTDYDSRWNEGAEGELNIKAQFAIRLAERVDGMTFYYDRKRDQWTSDMSEARIYTQRGRAQNAADKIRSHPAEVIEVDAVFLDYLAKVRWEAIRVTSPPLD